MADATDMTGQELIPVIDGHNDTLAHLKSVTEKKERSFLVESAWGHIDLPRARKGGLAAGIFALLAPPFPGTWGISDIILTDSGYSGPPAPAIELSYAEKFTEEMIKNLNELIVESRGDLRLIRETGELRSSIREKSLAVVLHFEGAEAIDRDLNNLDEFYDQGLRSIGIVWSRPNDFGYGVPYAFPSSPDIGAGLTAAGRELVSACNKHGIMIDLAHLNERGFWDVAGLTNKPLVVSHSAAHALCPSSRNLTDRQLDAIAESGGLVGAIFCCSNLTNDPDPANDKPIAAIVDQILYIIERIGIDHVAFGSDFDGATIPVELGDVTGLPKLMKQLRERGLNQQALRKIAHENWLRVLGETWS